MQFGIVLHVTATYATWDNFLAITKEAEQLGYDSVWVSDHFISPDGRRHGLESWTVLSALASATHKIRLGTYVLCNQFRHPSLLTKMASTLDNISNGRLELGIGAGWLEQEHRAFGFQWDKLSVRVERLKETLQILKKLWTESLMTFDGKYFRLENAVIEPKPIQGPYPTLWLGGNSRAIQRVVAEVGDGWIPVLLTPEELTIAVTYIKKEMKALGRDPQKLKVAYGGSGRALIAEDKESVKQLAEPMISSMTKPSERLACLIGTPQQCIEKIQQYQKAGAQKIVAGFYDFPSIKGMRLFARSVIPCFR